MIKQFDDGYTTEVDVVETYYTETFKEAQGTLAEKLRQNSKAAYDKDSYPYYWYGDVMEGQLTTKTKDWFEGRKVRRMHLLEDNHSVLWTIIS